MGYAAFYAMYGRHRPEETDRVRLFRLIKQPASSWLVKSDIVDLVWAVSETHSGLEFLRGSAEFLEAYVKTTALRIMWALSASGTGKITLQRWRRSAITEVRLGRVPPTPATSLHCRVGTSLPNQSDKTHWQPAFSPRPILPFEPRYSFSSMRRPTSTSRVTTFHTTTSTSSGAFQPCVAARLQLTKRVWTRLSVGRG